MWRQALQLLDAVAPSYPTLNIYIYDMSLGLEDREKRYSYNIIHTFISEITWKYAFIKKKEF